jgi:hypothetical protein
MPFVFIKLTGHVNFEDEGAEEVEIKDSDNVARLAGRVCTTLGLQAHARQVRLFLVPADRTEKILRREEVFNYARETPLVSIHSLALANVTEGSCLFALVLPPTPATTSGKHSSPTS